MTMFFRKTPNDVGNFAVLFQLNYNFFQMLALKVLTSLGALIGTLVGMYLGNIYMREYLALTSGGFLYFAINTLLSELKEV